MPAVHNPRFDSSITIFKLFSVFFYTDPYYLRITIFLVSINSDSDKLREFLHARIAKRKKKIHPEHSARFNHDMQLQIDSVEWVLEKTEVNKIPNDRLNGLIRRTIKDLSYLQ